MFTVSCARKLSTASSLSWKSFWWKQLIWGSFPCCPMPGSSDSEWVHTSVSHPPSLSVAIAPWCFYSADLSGNWSMGPDVSCGKMVVASYEVTSLVLWWPLFYLVRSLVWPHPTTIHLALSIPLNFSKGVTVVLGSWIILTDSLILSPINPNESNLSGFSDFRV